MKLKNLVLLGLFSVLLFSCITDGRLTKIDPYYIVHDNSSKVWLVNHCYKDHKDYAPLSAKYKQIITFHESRNCYVQRMNTFGDEAGRQGSFLLNTNEKLFKIEFADETWLFHTKFLSNEKIVLTPLENNFPYTLELIPVPEP